MIEKTTRLKLSKDQRVLSPKDFKRIYAGKYWANTTLYGFNALPSEKPRLGVTVSKKVSKLAVDRNRIKRQIKELYRLHQHELGNSEVVITAKPASLRATDIERKDSLEDLLAKIKRWYRWYERTQTSSEGT